MTHQKIYKYFVSYYYEVIDTYTTGIANMVVSTDCSNIKEESALQVITDLISSLHKCDFTENNDFKINPIILNIIPLPIEGK